MTDSAVPHETFKYDQVQLDSAYKSQKMLISDELAPYKKWHRRVLDRRRSIEQRSAAVDSHA
jgi:hypothetical protein